MSLSRKKIKQIHLVSVYSDLLDSYCDTVYKGGRPFDNPPAMWNEDESALFDLATQIEDRIKEKILQFLTPQSGEKTESK